MIKFKYCPIFGLSFYFDEDFNIDIKKNKFHK
jgi:hypothetical protein